jgi:Domain of unknown function (DUF4160)
MPTISSFYGILIQMFWRDHAPPHFHALYAEHEAFERSSSLRVVCRSEHLHYCSNGLRSTDRN